MTKERGLDDFKEYIIIKLIRPTMERYVDLVDAVRKAESGADLFEIRNDPKFADIWTRALTLAISKEVKENERLRKGNNKRVEDISRDKQK